MSLEVLQAVELSIALSAAEGAAARGEKLQFGPLVSIYRRIAVLKPLLALAVVPPQQAGQGERLAAGLAGVEVGGGVAEVATIPPVDITLWGGFWDGSWFCQREDVW